MDNNHCYWIALSLELRFFVNFHDVFMRWNEGAESGQKWRC